MTEVDTMPGVRAGAQRRKMLYSAETFILANAGDAVRAHLNLGAKFRTHGLKTWSIKDSRGDYTIGHVCSAVLQDVSFVVGKHGWEEIQGGGRKTVHAWVSGTLQLTSGTLRGDSPQCDVPVGSAVQVKYNPHVGMRWFSRADESGEFNIPVTSAKRVYLTSDWRVYAVEPVDMEVLDVRRPALDDLRQHGREEHG